MAIKRKLQVRYGAAASRPTLATGEFGLDSGTGVEKLWIGTPAGNAFVGPLSTTGEVKRYVAILNQSGTDAPTATVLENTLGGTVVWSYASAGRYLGTLASAFTNGKTVGFAQHLLTNAGTTLVKLFGNTDSSGSDFVELSVMNTSFSAANPTGGGKFYVMVLVYP